MVLTEVKSRLSWLSRTPTTYHSVLPTVLCTSFWYATEKTRLIEQERELLVTLFNRFVLDRIGRLLSMTNPILIEEGIRGLTPSRANRCRKKRSKERSKQIVETDRAASPYISSASAA